MGSEDKEARIRLLLVEDDRESREGIVEMLERRDVEVTTATDGEEALRLLDPERFDVVVSDIRMDGLSGTDVLRRIREKWRHFPVILLTGFDSMETAIEAVRLGAQDYILKPLDKIEDLLAPVSKAVWAYRTHLRNRQLRRELRESQEQMRALAARLQSVRDEEAARISREIHDGLGHELTAAKLQAARVRKLMDRRGEKGNEDEMRETVDSLLSLLDGTIGMVRRIATELRPPLLDHLGVGVAIEWQAREFEERTGIRCRVSNACADVKLTANMSMGFYRIFQEILTNAARHSGASEIEAEIACDEGELVLRVEDNGKGATEKELRRAPSLGILGMRERLRELGGTLSVSATPGGGTAVTARAPLQCPPPGMAPWQEVPDSSRDAARGSP